METHGIVAAWDAWLQEMQLWSASQNAHEVRAFCGRLLGLPEHRVHSMTGDVGGGFGQKVCVSKEEACVMLAAHALGVPLKWIEDRWENLLCGGHGRNDSMTVGLALDGDGRMLAIRGHLVEDVGAYPPSGTGSSAGFVGVMLPGPYRIPHVAFSSVSVYTNTGGRVAYRGPWLMETVGREQIVDAAAHELGIDPMDLRRRNIVGTGEMPYTTASGQTYDGIALEETLEAAAAGVGYDELRRLQAELRAEGRFVGIGCSAYVEPSGIAVAGLATEAVAIRVEPTGTVTVLAATSSTGNSVETTIPQIVADRLGCDVDAVRLVQGDTAATPFGNGMGGSRNAPVFGAAAHKAADELREKLLDLAAHALEAAVGDLETAAGRVSVRGTPTRGVTFAELAAIAYRSPAAMPDGMQPGLEVTYRFSPPNAFTWSDACHVCMCEVDAGTGQVTLLRYLVAEDCGVVINPMVVAGQVAGGVAQGIGQVLHEALLHDADGNPITTTFMDYLLPTSTEVPFVETVHVETPSTNPGGFRGMGEGGAIGAPAAVANAVNDALSPLGVALTSFPFRPSDIIDRIAAG
jgi:carbon-monoxide dehydrogenase large subunit